MSTKDKANELINKYCKLLPHTSMLLIRECALIAVNEMIKNDFVNRSTWQVSYWEGVKLDISQS